MFCSEEILNLSNYKYPIPESINLKENINQRYTIAILGTNDIHGAAFPMSLLNTNTDQRYNYGGFEYFASYINTLRKTWGNRLLWLDSGDEFQGTIESSLTKGKIITDFLNLFKLDGSTLGNHEFDFGRQFLSNRLNEAHWNNINSNIFNNITNTTEEFPNSIPYKIYSVGRIKIGVIGLTTKYTPMSTTGNITGLVFKDYERIVIDLSGKLRKQGSNAVLVNAHIGVYCKKDVEVKMTLKIWTKKDFQEDCEETDELYQLLYKLPDGTIDAVVAGHTHDIVHHWINKVPVIQTINSGYYFNLLYLFFDSNNKLITTEIEGPIPVCEKIYKHNKKCEFIDPNIKYNNIEDNNVYRFKFHNEIIDPDEKVTDLLKSTREQVKPY